MKSVQFILVNGVVKYVEMVRCSNLDVNHREYKPLYSERGVDVVNRKLKKIVAKTSWYEGTNFTKKINWRRWLPAEWVEDKPDQFRLPGMKFSTMLKVPSSRDGRLHNALGNVEYSQARNTGYQVKLVEKSGKPLSNLFPKDLSLSKCLKAWCPVCNGKDSNKPSLCGLKSVVYSGICKLCDASHKKTPSSPYRGVYIGQTYRTLAEPAKEHRTAYRDLKS